MGVELAGSALALLGIYQNWKLSGGEGSVKIATAKAQAALSLLARALDSIERVIRPQEPETRAQAGAADVAAAAYEASGSATATLTETAAGTVSIPDRPRPARIPLFDQHSHLDFEAATGLASDPSLGRLASTHGRSATSPPAARQHHRPAPRFARRA